MIAEKEHVIIVNEKDEWLGTAGKMHAHTEGLLHRAFSVFILNEHSEILLQKRARGKYHSAGLWSNSCCSHPRQGESTLMAAKRRLREELGFDCPLEKLFTRRYRFDVGAGLIENEYDHIYIGKFSGVPLPNPDEVEEWRFVSIGELNDWLQQEPGNFTAWFRVLYPDFVKHLGAHSKAA